MALLPGEVRSLKGQTPASGEKQRELDAETELLLFFAEEYLKQYKHYDNQRAKLAGILVAAVVGFSLAPFKLILPTENVVPQVMLVIASCAILITISYLSNIAARKHRFRMKTAYHRFSLARKRLCELHEAAELNVIHDKGEENAREELHKDDHEKLHKKPAKDKNGNLKKDSTGKPYHELKIEAQTRGLVWNRLPWIVGIYTVIYLVVYVLSLSTEIFM
ncbi:hypothetical protein FHS62_002318 [Amphiplicatus metriothermophilus]|uniref:hypothetical protein n=1 Tax=Amphiplicatus metriothermophilus TaxID=1519374 RepID=UPI00135973C8|nr:hypothetical protein [Amphiplicatus metriothermophilus]MBB5519493.1 hypothetical protein [Amphiplicatus metriothermophilus]